MKEKTTAKINELSERFSDSGVDIVKFCEDMLDEYPYTISDAEALQRLEACLTYKLKPDELTERQKELIKYSIRRDEIHLNMNSTEKGV